MRRKPEPVEHRAYPLSRFLYPPFVGLWYPLKVSGEVVACVVAPHVLLDPKEY